MVFHTLIAEKEVEGCHQKFLHPLPSLFPPSTLILGAFFRIPSLKSTCVVMKDCIPRIERYSFLLSTNHARFFHKLRDWPSRMEEFVFGATGFSRHVQTYLPRWYRKHWTRRQDYTGAIKENKIDWYCVDFLANPSSNQMIVRFHRDVNSDWVLKAPHTWH